MKRLEIPIRIYNGSMRRFVTFIALFIFSFTCSLSWSTDNTEVPVGRGPSGTVTLWAAMQPKDAVVLNQLLSSYHNDGFSSQIILKNFSSEEELKSALENAAKTNTAAVSSLPDIAVINTKWQSDLEPFLIPVEDLMNQVGSSLKVVAKMDTFSSIYKRCEKGNRLLTLPFSAKAYALLYNEKIFQQTGVKKLPSTWPELLGTAKQVLSKQPTFWGFVFPLEQGPAFLGELWGTVVHSNGGDNLLSRMASSTLQTWFDMIYKDKVAPVGEFSDIVNLASQAAMTVGDVQTLEKLREVNPRWKAAFLPKGKTRPLMADIFSLAIFKKSHKETGDLYQSYGAAWRAVHFLTEFPKALEWAMRTNHLPVNKQVYLSPYYISMIQKEKPWLRTYINLLALPFSTATLIEEEKNCQVIGNEILGALKKGQSVQESLYKAHNKLSRQNKEEGFVSPPADELKKIVYGVAGRVGVVIQKIDGAPLFFYTRMIF